MFLKLSFSFTSKLRMTPQLIFQICNIADFGVELRIIIRNSAIAQSRVLRLPTK